MCLVAFELNMYMDRHTQMVKPIQAPSQLSLSTHQKVWKKSYINPQNKCVINTRIKFTDIKKIINKLPTSTCALHQECCPVTTITLPGNTWSFNLK